MTSSPSTLPQPSHEGDEGQSAGRKTSRPPGTKKALSRVSDAEQQLVARYVDHDTACDDAQPGRTAEPRVMFEQPGGLYCDSTIVTRKTLDTADTRQRPSTASTVTTLSCLDAGFLSLFEGH